mmetsp:Transcript_24697/g.68877  ORF Transcript_24697/g.68877 Transcript_24697/m.68877 type:complete len:333 (+) Transcript_24697:673-1671(+)
MEYLRELERRDAYSLHASLLVRRGREIHEFSLAQCTVAIQVRRREDLREHLGAFAANALGLREVLRFLRLSDRLHVLADNAGHNTEQRPGAVDREHHEQRLQPWDFLQQWLEQSEVLAVHDREEREHGFGDRGEHLPGLVGEVRAQATTQHPGGQNGHGVQRDERQNQNPEHALHRFHEDDREVMKGAHGLDHADQSQDAHQSQCPGQSHHLSETRVRIAAAREKAPKPQAPLVEYAAEHDYQVGEVPVEVVLTREEASALISEADEEFGHEETEKSLVKPLKDWHINVGLEAHDHGIQSDNSPDGRLEPIGLRPGAVRGKKQVQAPNAAQG